jgi:hypothetical protein
LDELSLELPGGRGRESGNSELDGTGGHSLDRYLKMVYVDEMYLTI